MPYILDVSSYYYTYIGYLNILGFYTSNQIRTKMNNIIIFDYLMILEIFRVDTKYINRIR